MSETHPHTLLTLTPIAHIVSDFPEKFGIPRQSGLVDALEALVVFEPAFRDENALRGLEGFSHLWLIWEFSQARRQGWSPTVRPPRMGGNQRLGVFATRSPFRPNPLGLSCVRLLGLEKHPGQGTVLRVAGADLMDGTPIYDIKPYLPLADCHPQARGGFAEETPWHPLQVELPPHAAEALPPAKLEALCAVLAQDPRPAYQEDTQRIYGFSFAGVTVRFQVAGDVLTVLSLAQDAD